MTIDEAIRARLDRFNRLWLKAEGHTFEDDPKVKKEQYEKDMTEWAPKMEKRIAELGYSSENDYLHYVIENNVPFEDRDPEVQRLWETKPRYQSLYDYEKTVLDDAEKIAKYIDGKFEGTGNEKWEQALDGETSAFPFLDKLEREHGIKIYDGHSVNSACMVVLFAQCLIMRPDMFQYMHGALSPLVGDVGYHDDRSDLPELKEETEE